MSAGTPTRKTTPVLITDGSQSTVSVDDTAGGATLAAAKAAGSYRRALVFQNRGSSTLYYTLDGTTPTTSNGFTLLAGATAFFYDGVPQQEVQAIRDTGESGDVIVFEG